MTRSLILLTILILSSALLAGLFNIGEPAKTTFDAVQKNKVVEIHAEKIPALYGKPFNDISLYSVQDGVMQPIPFQVEEFEHKGASYPESKSKEKPAFGILDGNDLLVFMFKDSGVKANKDQIKTLEVVSTLKLEDSGIESYIYLIRNGERSDKRYVHYNENTGIITMPNATIHMNPKDLLDWRDFVPVKEGSMENKSLLDCLKIRINGKFLAFQLRLNNQNLKAKLKNVYQGPVRITLDGKIQAIVAKIPLVSADAQMHFDSTSARLYIDMKTPDQINKLVKNPVVLVGVDGNNLYGQSVMTSVSGDAVYQVNGKMDEQENSLNEVKVKEPVSWIWLRDNEDVNLIGQYDLGANNNFDPAKFPDISVYYQDDEKLVDEPERFKGAVPTLGYRLEGIPETRTIRMSYKVLIVEGLKDITAGKYLDELDKAVQVSVSVGSE